MNHRKPLYYQLEYIMPKKDGEGDIKIMLDFNKNYMKYTEIDVTEDVCKKLMYIRGYDYWLALDALLEAEAYRSTWLGIRYLV